MKFVRNVAAAIALFVMSVSPAFADQTAEAKSALKVDKKKHLPVDETSEFTAGQKVFVWSKLTDTKGKNFAHVWKKDGKIVAQYKFEGKAETMYRYTNMPYAKAGSYTVEVQSGDGAVLTSVSFNVK
jgi:hypothetical protein